MAKFHINPETGNPGKCSAQIQCRFGQSEAQHGTTREEAQANYEKHMEAELFANTKRATEPLTTQDLHKLKEELFDSPSSFTPLWSNKHAQVAAIRHSLERWGVDSSNLDSRKLKEGNYYKLNQEGTEIVGVFSSELDSIGASGGKTKSRSVLEIEAKELLAAAEYNPAMAMPLLRSLRTTLLKEKLTRKSTRKS